MENDLNVWFDKILSKAEELDIVYFIDEDVQADIDNNIRINCTEDNVQKLLKVAEKDNLPVFIERHIVDEDFIESCRLGLSELKEHPTFHFIEEQQTKSKIISHAINHNSVLSDIPATMTLSIVLFTILKSGHALIIRKTHEKYDEWYEALYNTTIDSLIIENLDEEVIEEYHNIIGKEKEAELKHIKEAIYDKWSRYLESQNEFYQCTNQKMRRYFRSKVLSEFIYDKCTKQEADNFYLISMADLDQVTDLTWKKVKRA